MKLLLVGAGYLARRIISDHPNNSFIALRRSPSSEDLLAKAEYGYVDLFNLNKTFVKEVTSIFDGYVIVMLSPSSYIGAIEGSIADVARLFDQNLLKKVILVSSTGVYSDGYKNIIDNSFIPTPVNTRALKLRAIETEWCKRFENVVIVRLGGLYCSERVVGLNTLLAGGVIDGDGQESLNLIHSSDAARVILKLCRSQFNEGTFLVTDCNPVRRYDYYSYISKLYGTKPPKFSNKSRKSYTCKALSVWSSLCLEPKYSNYIAGLA